MNKNYILIDSNEGRFGNQLYPIFVALTYYEHNKDKFHEKIYFKNIFLEGLGRYRLEPSMFAQLPESVKTILDINLENYQRIEENSTSVSYLDYPIDLPNDFNNNLLIHNYCQMANKIDVNVIRKYFECPKEIKNKIFELYGDISDAVCLHVRRGDYVTSPYFYLLSKEYIETLIEKYFKNKKIIYVSDSLQWGKINLGHIPNIIFADKCEKEERAIMDFYTLTLTQYNICSPSSFCMAAAMLNPNNNIYVPYPYYKYEPWNKDAELNIIPSYAHKIDYKLGEDKKYIYPK